jgi:peptidoglycan hydrolase CwlO-like protein
MKRLILVGLTLVLACAVGGCGGTEKHEAVMKELIGALNDFASALESVKDNASAKEAAAKIDKVTAQLGDIAKKAEGLKATKAQNEALEKKFKPEMEKLEARIKKAGESAGTAAPGNPDLQAAMLRLMAKASEIQSKVGGK